MQQLQTTVSPGTADQWERGCCEQLRQGALYCRQGDSGLGARQN